MSLVASGSAWMLEWLSCWFNISMRNLAVERPTLRCLPVNACSRGPPSPSADFHTATTSDLYSLNSTVSCFLSHSLVTAVMDWEISGIFLQICGKVAVNFRTNFARIFPNIVQEKTSNKRCKLIAGWTHTVQRMKIVSSSAYVKYSADHDLQADNP